jgi:hypothetical protein
MSMSTFKEINAYSYALNNSEYCYYRPFGPTISEIVVFFPLNFKNYPLFEFRSYRKSN